MAENRTINIDIKQNADQVTQDFNELNSSVKEVNKSLKDTQNVASSGKGIDTFAAKLDELDKKLATGNLSTREMTKLIKEYQTVATQAGTQSPVGDRAIRAAAGLKDTLTDLQVRTKLLSSDYIKLDTTLAAIGTGAQAFSGIQSAMALTGVENEELQKTMVKLQAVQGVSNSISAVTNALNKDAILGIQARIAIEKVQAVVIGKTTGAMKLLRVAMSSIGIGVLIAGIGLLVANFDKVWNVIKQGIDIALVPLKSALDVVVDSYYAVTDALGITSKQEREREKQAKQIATEEQKRAAERKRQHEELKKQIDESVGKIERLQFARKKAYDDEIALLQASGKETARVERQKLKDIVETQKEILKERMKQEDFFAKLYAKNQVEQAEFQLKLFDAKIGKELSDKQKEQANKRRELLRQIQDEEIKQIEDQSQREQTQLIVSADRRIEDIKKSEGDAKLKAKLIKEVQETLLMELEELDKKYYEKQKAEEDKRRDASINIKAKTTADIYKKEESAQTALLSLYGLGLQERIKAEQEAAAKRKELIEQSVNLTLQGLDLISSIAEANAGKDEKRQRAAFNIRKASNIAQATVDGYKAVLSTYADTPGGVIIKGIAATLAGAFAALKISQIAKSRYQSSSGGGGGSDLASGVPTSTPQFNTIGSSGINQLAQLQQQPVQAYVVSGEVTSAQALDRNRIQNATL